MNSELMRGGFGDVRRATLRRGDLWEQVAVKSLRSEGNEEQRLRVEIVRRTH